MVRNRLRTTQSDIFSIMHEDTLNSEVRTRCHLGLNNRTKVCFFSKPFVLESHSCILPSTTNYNNGSTEPLLYDH